MIISAEQLHGLLAAIRAEKITVVEAAGLRPVGPSLTPGEQVRVDVLAKLPSGQSLTNLAGQLVSMQLPADIKPGDVMRLTYVTDMPRPTFALSQSERQGAPTTISDTARWLGQITRDQTTPGTSLARPTQLLSAPPTNPQQLADRLQQILTQSGVFYETHLAEWATGERPLARLLQEPQGSISQPAAFQKAAEAPLPPQNMTQTGPGQPPGPQSPSPTAFTSPLPEIPETPGTAPPPSSPTSGTVPSTDRTPATSATPTASATPPPPAPATAPSASPATTTGQPLAAAAAESVLPATPGVQPQPQPTSESMTTGSAVSGPHPSDELTTATLADRQPAPAPAVAQQPDRQESLARAYRPGVQPQGEARVADQPGQSPSLLPHQVAQHESTTEQMRAGNTLPVTDPADPRTIPLIREQLELLQNRTFCWQGEGWPGQPLQWQVEERDANPDEAAPHTWHSTLQIDLPRLGKVQASLHLVGSSLRIDIAGSSTPSIKEMQTAAGKLREQFEAHGLTLQAFEVSND